MAVKIDDVSLSPTGGAVLSEIAVDRTNPLGILVQLRGANATAATAECVVTRGSASVTLVTTIAAGEVTASITAANLTTLGAGIGSRVTAWWRVTVVDGSATHTAEYEEHLGVSDRVLRFPLDYSRITTRVLALGRSCAVPTGQTNFWPQIRLSLGDLRDDINSEQADVKTYMLGHEGVTRQIAEAYALVECVSAAMGNANGQGDFLGMKYGEFMQAKLAKWASLILSVRDTSAWQTTGTSGERLASPPRLFSGRATGIGGAL